MAARSPAASVTSRMPRPPPPAEAFTNSGKPTERPAPAKVRGRARSTGALGSVGTPASDISAFAAGLSPIWAMTSGLGPTKTRPASCIAAANSGRSDPKPYPGWTASAPVAAAAATIFAWSR